MGCLGGTIGCAGGVGGCTEGTGGTTGGIMWVAEVQGVPISHIYLCCRLCNKKLI